MNLPTEITQRVLAEFASPADSKAIRIILVTSAGSGAFRLCGKRRKYIFERNNDVGAHILDIPLSLWQHDLPKGVYRENLSICHDIQTITGLKIPLIFLIAPWGSNDSGHSLPECPDSLPEPRTAKALRDYLSLVVQAPPHIIDQIDSLLQMDLISIENLISAGSIDGPAENHQPVNDPPSRLGTRGPAPSSESPAALRMREKRAADKAMREANKSQTV